MHVSNVVCQHLTIEPKLARDAQNASCFRIFFWDLDRCPLHFRTEVLYDSLSFNPWCCDRYGGIGPLRWRESGASAAGSMSCMCLAEPGCRRASVFARNAHA